MLKLQKLFVKFVVLNDNFIENIFSSRIIESIIDEIISEEFDLLQSLGYHCDYEDNGYIIKFSK